MLKTEIQVICSYSMLFKRELAPYIDKAVIVTCNDLTAVGLFYR